MQKKPTNSRRRSKEGIEKVDNEWLAELMKIIATIFINGLVRQPKNNNKKGYYRPQVLFFFYLQAIRHYYSIILPIEAWNNSYSDDEPVKSGKVATGHWWVE